MRSETLSLVAAIAVHAGAMVVAPHFIDPNAMQRFMQSRVAQPIEIDLSELKIQEVEPSPSEAVRAPEPQPSEVLPSPAVDGRVAKVERAPAGSVLPPGSVVEPGVPGPESTAVPNAPPGPAGPPGDHYEPLRPDDGRGLVMAPPGLGSPIYTLPGMMPDLPKAAAASTVAPKARPVDKDIAGIIVRDEMAKNDKKAGFDLPAAGTVNSTVRSAVQGAADVPDTARASFAVRLGPGGQVLGVSVSNFNAGSAGVWDQVARAIQAALASKKFELTDAYAKGATVYVDVSVAMTLPSGAAGSVSHEGSGIKFDTSDIGAHKRRSVRATFRTVAAR